MAVILDAITGQILVTTKPITGGGGGGGVTSVGTIDSQVATSDGASIHSTSIYMQSASASVPGLVNNTTQTLSGNKTFAGTIAASNLSGTNTGDVSLAALGSAPSASGASLSGQILTLQPADASHPGLVSIATQTFAGDKTFSGTITASNFSGSSSGTNTGDVTIATFGSAPTNNGATLSGQALTLQPADATHPGSITAGVQTIGGAKTFASTISASNLSGTNTGDITITAAGSTPAAAGASLSGQALTLQPADATNPGLITAGIQTIGGAKTFASTISASNLSGTNTGDVTIATFGAAPANNGATISGQAITIQPADATHPGAITSGTQTIGGAKTFVSTISASNFSGSSSGTNTGDISLATVGASPAVTGATLAGQVLTLQPADATNAGVVSTTTQSFAGAKTFTGAISASNLSGTNTGDITLATIGASPAAAGASLSAQVLTLQPADATNGGVLSNTTQSIKGAKTFVDAIAASNFSGSSSGTNTGDVVLSAVGSTPGANGALLTGQSLALQPADGSFPGVITAGTQTIGGAKTFASTITASNLSGSNTGDVTIATFGAAPAANGATISGQAITIQPADGTHPGAITSGTQTIGGAKTFASTITASNLSGTNTGDITLATVGSTPAAAGASLSSQVLTLQPADATNAGVVSTTTQTFAGTKTFNTQITGSISGSSGSFTGSLSGDVTGTQSATAIAASVVTGKLLTGLVAAMGTISASDSILTAFNKAAAEGVASNLARFGDGSDGTVTISAGTTTLTRDIYYAGLTINGTGTLRPVGFRIFGTGTLDLTAAPSAAIALNSAGAGNGGNSGTAGTAGTSPAGATLGGGVVGQAGGTGTIGAGAQGGATLNANTCNGGAGGDGAAGGSGSAGANAGGNLRGAGTSSNAIPMRRFEPNMIRGATLIQGSAPGGAGGSGGGDGVVSGGGGGGGAGGTGVIWISFNIISRGASTTANAIQTDGGQGGNGGSPASGNAGGGGAGGAAGGGHVIINYGSLSGSSATNAISASGGNGGNGGNGQGTGLGGNGGASGAGGRITLINLTTGVVSDSTGSASVAGSTTVNATGATGAAKNTFQVTL